MTFGWSGLYRGGPILEGESRTRKDCHDGGVRKPPCGLEPAVDTGGSLFWGIESTEGQSPDNIHHGG